MEFQVRDARLTDIDRMAVLLASAGLRSAQADGTDTIANLLRQLVYLPNATVSVGLAGRRVIGFAVLALRPSVREGGLIGTLDVLAVDPGLEQEGVAEALLEEALRSARNKGCVMVEATQPEDEVQYERLQRYGFRVSDAGARMVRSTSSVGAAEPSGTGPIDHMTPVRPGRSGRATT